MYLHFCSLLCSCQHQSSISKAQHECRDIISNKSKAAAGLCDWAINIVKYYDVVSEVEPKRIELAGANEKLAAANSTLKQVQDKVALLNAQVKELEDQYNKVSSLLCTQGSSKQLYCALCHPLLSPLRCHKVTMVQ